MLEPPKDREIREFLAYLIETLERLQIPYMIVGGFAAILYGEPRLTIDVDIVVDLKPEQVGPLVMAFPISDYYISEEGVRDSVERRYPFNIIQPSTGAKIDLVPLTGDPLTRRAFQRRQRMTYGEEGRSAWFISAQDIVIAKLVAYRQTGSDKHLRDARGVLIVQGTELDLEAVHRAAAAGGLLAEFERLLELTRGKGEGQ